MGGGTFIVRHDDYVFTKFGIASQGEYIIGIHAHQQISYTLSVHVVKESDDDQEPLANLKKLFFGRSIEF